METRRMKLRKSSRENKTESGRTKNMKNYAKVHELMLEKWKN